jgi:mutator mutT protein
MKKEASLSIIEDTTTHKFLMIRHLRGINKGCINFPGGKREDKETMEECVIRETLEETGLHIKNPKQVGYIEFPSKDFYVYVFKSTEFSGMLHENKDEVHTFWIEKDKVPYEEMREADRDFLPDILAEKFVRRRYIYDENFHLKKIINLD